MSRLTPLTVSQLARSAARSTRAGAFAPDAALHALADTLPIMLWTCDSDGRCTYFNRAWLMFTGRPLEEELGWGWLEGMHLDDRSACRQRFTQAQRTRGAFTLEYRLRRADGEFRWVLGHGSPQLDPGGRVAGYIGSAADISDRREELVALADSEHSFRRLIENAEDMVYRLRLWPTRAVEYVGGAVEAITGRPAVDFYTDPALPRAAVHPDDVRHIADTPESAAQMTRVVTIRWIHPNGRVIWAEHRRGPVLDSNGRLIAVEGIARDVTARVRTQQQLRRSQEQLRRLAARVESAREEERTALARELHDELGQGLTAIKMELIRANGVFQKARLQPKTVDRLQALIGLTEIAIATVKRISTDLRPPALDHLDLGDAIRWEGDTFRARTGLRCRVKADGEGRSLTAHQQTVVFRIFQEALNNVVRHARASAVQVSLVERSGIFELQVQDNGRGITAAQRADPTSIGLLGMRERAELIGGTFEITGRRGKGTIVTVRLPLPEAPPSTTTGRRRAERRQS